jgi:hypothetical protein
VLGNLIRNVPDGSTVDERSIMFFKCGVLDAFADRRITCLHQNLVFRHPDPNRDIQLVTAVKGS